MAKFPVRKTLAGHLAPTTDEGVEGVRKMKPGQEYQIVLTMPRNYKFHCKFFALLKVVYENQEKYDNYEAFRHEVQMRCGHYAAHTHLTGLVSYVPKSISFADMDEIQFSALYDRAIDVLIENFIPGTDRDELIAEVINFGS